MDDLADLHHDDVDSVFVYTREAHPGERHGHHTSLSDKLRSARLFVDRFAVRRRVLVDALEGAVHRAYGELPNMTYIVRRGGKIHYRSSWTDTNTIAPALAGLAEEIRSRAAGELPLPYWVEWEPARPRDRIAFVRGLRDGGGDRAVEEYLAAARGAFGPQSVAPLQQWWDAELRSRSG